ncbi:MAG: YhbY family RNA-binding protein [Pseudomonadales bacterium]|jgi:RNA-binding protein|nr:YhbY family RNA-binding protein [Pseudomonadales bacterium]
MHSDNTLRRKYRAIGHKLQPVVIVKALSDSVLAEIERALNDHELIKLRVLAEDREEKAALIDAIGAATGAELIQVAGHVALFLRKALKVKPELSNLQRYKVLMD